MVSPFDLNLRHLRGLVAIHDQGGVSAAAATLNVSQPALTHGLVKLEGLLGQVLFERRPHGMRPTDAGERMVLRARSALAQLAAAARLLMRDKGSPLPRMTMVQLRALLALMETGTFAAAAASVGLSQTAVHRAVRDLEAAVGRQLAERHGRAVQVNFSGRRLARSARLAIGELQAGFAELGVGTEGNTIAIGTTPLARAFLVPEAMATMVPDPEQTVGGFQVLEGNWGDLVELLRDGLIHLIVGELPQHDSPDLAKQPLHQESLLIVAGRQHPLAGKLAPHLDALASYPWIVSPPGSPLRAEWERLFDGRPLPAAPIECGSIMIVGRLLTSSDLLALTTPDQVALQIRSGLLARVGPALGDRRHAIGITMRRGWRPTGQQQRFIEALARVSSGMTAHGGNAGRVARSWNRRP